MHLTVVQRILGLLLGLFSTTLLPPIAVSLISGDGALDQFLVAFAVTLCTGVLLWLPVRNHRHELRMRDGFLIVVLFWTVLSLFGSLPFFLSHGVSMSLTDAVFESVSGLTTTGATVITGLDSLPPSLLYYRQQLQWLGGMGIIVLAVAILPMLGIGGMQLYRAETPGPMKDSKLTPRITETAKALWYIYLGLTIACALAYWAAGMNMFDAIGHSFSTVAIGGFSTHDASMGFYRGESTIQLIAIIFMLLSGVNFALHFVAWRGRSIRNYFFDEEFRTYFKFLAYATIATSLYLWLSGRFHDPFAALLSGAFQVVSFGTTTGFTTHDHSHWPSFLPVLLIFLSFVGGCAGSTGGGIKVIRFLLLVKQGLREIKRLIHPNAMIPIRIGGKSVPDRVIDSVWGFFATYVAIFSLLMLLLMASGLDQVTAFSAVAACLNNLGPGLGDVGLNYASLNDFAKWLLCFAMLLGRLEIFTLLVLLTPAFWRK